MALRIKNNVDLKELEKFGFKNKCGKIWKPKKGEWNVIEVEVDSETRIIDISGLPDSFHTKEDTLYDLIEAKLVEKVEDK